MFKLEGHFLLCWPVLVQWVQLWVPFLRGLCSFPGISKLEPRGIWKWRWRNQECWAWRRARPVNSQLCGLGQFYMSRTLQAQVSSCVVCTCSVVESQIENIRESTSSIIKFYLLLFYYYLNSLWGQTYSKKKSSIVWKVLELEGPNANFSTATW